MPEAPWSDYTILSKQTYLMTDFTAMGMAATFFNVACHFSVIAYILACPHAVTSHTASAAAGIFAGHALFGPIFYGAHYSRWTGFFGSTGQPSPLRRQSLYLLLAIAPGFPGGGR